MTPEKAEYLLDGTTPGPWDAFMSTSGQVVINHGEYENYDDVLLAAAAPDLAELVAGLRYEYAVQVIEDGHTWYINSYKTLTSGSRSAEWLPTFESADALRRKCVTELCLQERCALTFIARRLTTELEVIDPEVVS